MDSAGNQANNASDGASISADGRYIAFVSAATNLVPNDTNEDADVFVHDRQTGLTERVNVSDGEVQANAGSWEATLQHTAISDDGRFVAFNSLASNLVPGGSPGSVDVFLRDRDHQTTRRVARGEISDTSADGRFVVFYNIGSTFLWDATTGISEMIARDGGQGAVSADGRYVAFIDGKGILLRDRRTQTTRTIQPGSIIWPSISNDGRYIAFEWRTSVDAPDGGTGIFVYDLETDSVQQVASGWRPKVGAYGGHVVYTSQIGYQGAPLRVFDLRAGTDEPIQANASAGCIVGAPQDISGDGRFVAFSSCTPDVVPGDTNECGFGPAGTCPDIFVHDRGEQPGAPTAPAVAVGSPVPVSPEETTIATPCEPAPASSSQDPSVEAGPLASGTPSPAAIDTPTSAPPESSSAVSPCSGDELSPTDDVETQTSLNITGVAGAAVVASLLAGASAFGYLRFRLRRLG